MTDRDLLVSLKAQIDAHFAPTPQPVDEVIAWQMTEAGPLSACQPNNHKHRSETWTAVTVTPAAHGGKPYAGPRTEIRTNSEAEACVYIPPTGRVIQYRIEIMDPSHQHSFFDAAEMKSWVPAYKPRIPEPVPCVIEWIGYDGTVHKHAFATFAEFLAFVKAFVPEPPPIKEPDPDVLLFPGQLEWAEVWPGWTPATSLSFAPAGWLAGTGFKERRAFVEANWWDTGLRAGTDHEGDIDHARHLHIGAAFPREVSGVFDLFARVRTFHWTEAKLAGITKISFTKVGSRKMAPNPFQNPKDSSAVSIMKLPLTEHIQDVCVPIRIDTRNCPNDGWCLFVIEADIQRNDGVHHLVNVKVPVYVNNGRPVQNEGGTGLVQATGWMTEFVVDPVTGKKHELNTFGYLEANCLAATVAGVKGPRRFVADPHPSYTFRASTGAGRFPVAVLVTKDPNFHLHPPVPREDSAYMGQVLAETDVKSSSTNVTVPSTAIGAGNRIVCRVSDAKPVGYVFATLPDGSRVVKSAAAVLPEGSVVDTANPITLTDPQGAVATVLAITVGA